MKEWKPELINARALEVSPIGRRFSPSQGPVWTNRLSHRLSLTMKPRMNHNVKKRMPKRLSKRKPLFKDNDGQHLLSRAATDPIPPPSAGAASKEWAVRVLSATIYVLLNITAGHKVIQ